MSLTANATETSTAVSSLTTGSLLLAAPSLLPTTNVIASGTFNLTGADDWIEFPASWTPNTKAGGGNTIGQPTFTNPNEGNGTYSPSGITVTWSDGTSPASGSSQGEIYSNISNFVPGMGLQFTLPADTAQRTATIYWGVYSGTAQLQATMGDGSVPVVTQGYQASADASNVKYASTITYEALTPTTLNVALTMTATGAGPGNVALQAATVSRTGVVGTAVHTGATSALVTIRNVTAVAIESSTSTSALSTGIKVAASASETSTAAASLQTSIRLAAASSEHSASTAGLITGLVLRGAANESSLASASLQTAIYLASSGGEASTATAALTVGAGLFAGASEFSSASANLSTSILLLGAGSESSTASALLATGGDGTIGAIASEYSQATAALHTVTSLSAEANQAIEAVAALETVILLTASAIEQSSALSNLSTALQSIAAANETTTAAADLSATTTLSASALEFTTATANLIHIWAAMTETTTVVATLGEWVAPYEVFPVVFEQRTFDVLVSERVFPVTIEGPPAEYVSPYGKPIANPPLPKPHDLIYPAGWFAPPPKKATH